MYINKISVGMLQTNCYIIADEATKSAAVIDPGADCDRIMDVINTNKFNLEYIIITHSHIDHIGAVDMLKDTTAAKIVISTADSATLNNSEYTLSSMLGERAPVSNADITVSDGDSLTVAGKAAKFIMTPGHTPGSMCVYFDDDKILFSGDTLFYESIGRTDFPCGSYATIANSIRNKLYTLNDDVRVLPGHNNDTTILHEKENNFYI